MNLILDHQHVDVNMKNRKGLTTLHEACIEGNETAVKLLLAHHDIDVDITVDNKTMTALHYACQGKCLDIVKMLWTHKPNFSRKAKDSNGKTAEDYLQKNDALKSATYWLKKLEGNV